MFGQILLFYTTVKIWMINVIYYELVWNKTCYIKIIVTEGLVEVTWKKLCFKQHLKQQVKSIMNDTACS